MAMKCTAISILLASSIFACSCQDPAPAKNPDSGNQDGGTFQTDLGASRLDSGGLVTDARGNTMDDASSQNLDGQIADGPGFDGGPADPDAGPSQTDAQTRADIGHLPDSGVPPTALQIQPDFISLAMGQTQNLSVDIPPGVAAIWSVDGVAGGNASLGNLVTSANDIRSATFTAPQNASVIPVTRSITVHTFGGLGTALLTLIAPTPSINNVSPNAVDIGAGDTSIVITGQGFVSSTVVELDGVTIMKQYQDWNRIEAIIPAQLLTRAGRRRLVARSPAPGGGIAAIDFKVILRRDILGSNVAANVPSLFNSAIAGSNATLQPALQYPENGAYTPRDFPSPRFSWTHAAAHNVCRVSLRSPTVFVDVYVSSSGLAANENPNLELTSADWIDVISTSVQEFTLSYSVICAEVSGNALTNNSIYESGARDYVITAHDTGGRIVYFSGLVQGLWYIDIAANTAAAEPWIGPDSSFRLQTSECVGCHSFSRNGQRMSYATRSPEWSVELLDIVTSTPSIDVSGTQGAEAVWTSLHPDGTYVLVTDLTSQLVLLDGSTGQVVAQVPTSAAGANSTLAFWSPQGDEFAFVTGTENVNGVTDFADGEIWTMSFSTASGQPQFGAPVRIAGPDVVGGTAYYPAYTPDGDYLIFCRAPSGSAYNNPGAKLWMAKADGSMPAVRLDAANQSGDLYNSWPRWAPSTSDGRYWLMFSSQRSYPPYTNTGPQQLWVTLVDPAALPADPSKPAIWLSGQAPFTGNLTAEWTIAQ